ncbi:NAD(+) ADP-ribosyltransferase [Rubrivivax gelatinosus]|nr:NAD(+) ADP-ribosyltransferase [Rubrivivax gelatinosus]
MTAGDDLEASPERWYTTNLVGLPAPVLASLAFNEHPQPLHIAGARETQPGLFALLGRSPDAEQARDVFQHYMSLSFGLGVPAADAGEAESHRWRTSYLKLIQGWVLDSNSAAGAVLKGWVESRFGLVPTFHRAPLGRYPSPAWMRYLEEKAGSRFHNNCIWQQLDLVFEYCQWMLARFELMGAGPYVTLWRGSSNVEEQIVAGSLRARRCTVRLNNIVSFSRSREHAGCFGDWIFEARVPLAKLLLVPGLLSTRSLQSEGEVLAIGGLYDLQVRCD